MADTKPSAHNLRPYGRKRVLESEEKVQRVGVELTQAEILRQFGLEVDLILFEGIKTAKFRMYLIEHPDVLIEFKKAAGQSEIIPLKLSNTETVRLIKAMATHQPAALLKIIGREGCQKLYELLKQRPGDST